GIQKPYVTGEMLVRVWHEPCVGANRFRDAAEVAHAGDAHRQVNAALRALRGAGVAQGLERDGSGEHLEAGIEYRGVQQVLREIVARLGGNLDVGKRLAFAAAELAHALERFAVLDADLLEVPIEVRAGNVDRAPVADAV